MTATKPTKYVKAFRLIKDRLVGESRRLFGFDPGAQPTARLAIERWLLRLGSVPAERGRVLITALRSGTWIEWAAYAACVLRQKGFTTTLLFKSSQIAKLYPEIRPFNFWARVADIPDIRFVDLDTLPTPLPGEEYQRLASERGAAGVAYDHHIEQADVPAHPELYAAAVDDLETQIARAGSALESYLSENRFHRFLCYSGLIAESPGLLEAARRQNQDTVCLEGWSWRPGHMIYNFNAPALEYNVEGWMRAGGGWDESKEKEIDAYLKFLDGERQDDNAWLDNFYRIQRDKLSAELPPALASFLSGDEPVFLAAPNVIGDSSMLSRETIFPGMQIWLSELIEWFKARPHLKLVIRAHPAEIWVRSKCVIHIGKFARRVAAGVPNVFVLDAADKVNTFSLVPFIRAGLAWLSSAGVDFVVRGIPAVVAAKPKYAGLGIVEEPATTEAYFTLLGEWAEATPRPRPAQMLAGRQYLHMVFKGFSFEAGSRTYRADRLFLGAMPNQAEHDRFFRIIMGDEAMPDRQ